MFYSTVSFFSQRDGWAHGDPTSEKINRIENHKEISKNKIRKKKKVVGKNHCNIGVLYFTSEIIERLNGFNWDLTEFKQLLELYCWKRDYQK